MVDVDFDGDGNVDMDRPALTHARVNAWASTSTLPSPSKSTATSKTTATPDATRRDGQVAHQRRAEEPYVSMKLFNCLLRLGCRNLRSALASICRMRSRVTSKS
jgi:septal ring-binding cell division protein DamX